jgi:hypothetical protein
MLATPSSGDQLRPNITAIRQKRDGGATIGAAVIGAVVTVGSAIAQSSRRPRGNAGGCQWFGTHPFCNGVCPPNEGWVNVKTASSQNKMFFGSIEFGLSCWDGTKMLCCKKHDDRAAQEWAGTWSDIWNQSFNCRVDYQEDGKCNGKLTCSTTMLGDYDFVIGGPRCNKLYGKVLSKNLLVAEAFTGMIKFKKQTVSSDALIGLINDQRAGTYRWFKV